MDIKGYVFVKPTFEKTINWPKNILVNYDMEEDYKQAFAGKKCACVDIAVDNSGYLLVGETENSGTVLWCIEKEDTIFFIPRLNPLKSLLNYLNMEE